MSDEQGLIMLIQQYASKFGITFSSSLMDNEEHKQKLLMLMMDAINGKRGPVTDQDVTGA
ncbi:hypothetical protein ACW4YW_01735 [Methylobacillus pratensis]|uniref:Uncharacterized protein n=1 Tax=Methylobacillus methanolivorans TaxID=1848927 RepID=A0ABW8GI52_9PROT